MNELQLLSEKLSALRAGQLDIDEFQSWITAFNESFSKIIPRGVFLKMKRGDIGKVMSAAISIFPSCTKCNKIFGQGEFANRLEHNRCTIAINKAIRNGTLTKIIRPNWYKPSPGQLGVDSYYKCSSCNAIWNLVEPERHCNGLWDRVA